MTEGPTLLLMRHGQIKANRTGHWHGSTDSPLTFAGRRQARRTARYLQAIDCTAVYTSPLLRCQRTAELATRHHDLDIMTLDGLREMSIGEWEGISFKDLHEEYDLFTQLKDPHFRPPEGESLHDVATRVRSALVEIDRKHGPDDIVLVVSHGVAMGTAVADLMHATPTRWRDYHFDNCSLTELLVSPEPLVVSFNQTTHL